MGLLARRLRKEDSRAIEARYRGWRSRRPIKVQPSQVADAFHPVSIVKGLNEHPASPATKRVCRFIHLFKQARDFNDSLRLFFESREDMMHFLYHSPRLATYENKGIVGTNWTFNVPEIQALNNQLNSVLTKLNALAKRYRWHPVIRHMGYEMGGEIAFDIIDHWDVKDPRREWETRSIWWLCGHGGKWIDFFRQCRDCSRWFFALAEHQSYCGNACRQRHASCSDEFKQRRRLYMQAYRQAEKQRERRAKALARIPQRSK